VRGRLVGRFSPRKSFRYLSRNWPGREQVSPQLPSDMEYAYGPVHVIVTSLLLGNQLPRQPLVATVKSALMWLPVLYPRAQNYLTGRQQVKNTCTL